MVETTNFPFSIQFYENPLYINDWSETISDGCLIFSRLGIGAFVEVTEAPAAAAPAERVYRVRVVSQDYLILPIFFSLVALTIWLPLTLLGLCLVYCSESHQANANDWKTAVRVDRFQRGFDQSLAQKFIDEEPDRIYSWMVEKLYEHGTSEDKRIFVLALIASENGGCRMASQQISSITFRDLIGICLRMENSANLLNSVVEHSDLSRKQLIKQAMEAKTDQLPQEHAELLKKLVV